MMLWILLGVVVLVLWFARGLLLATVSGFLSGDGRDVAPGTSADTARQVNRAMTPTHANFR